MPITCIVAYFTARSSLRKTVTTNISYLKRHALHPEQFLLQADFQLSHQFSNTNVILRIKTFKNLASIVKLNSYLAFYYSRSQFPTETVSIFLLLLTLLHCLLFLWNNIRIYTQQHLYDILDMPTALHTRHAATDENEKLPLRLIDS
jgi:hypothetical protein